MYNIVKLDFNGSNVEVLKSGITSTTYCIAVDITGKLWDSRKACDLVSEHIN